MYKYLNVDNEEEEWVDIPGYEGLYQINPWGDVKSLHKKSNGALLKRIAPTKVNANETYFLYKDTIQKTESIAQLVARTFLINHQDSNMVIYRDGNRLNTHVSNLKWKGLDKNKRPTKKKLQNIKPELA